MDNKITLEFEAKLEKATQALKSASSMVRTMSNEVRATQTSFKTASNQVAAFTQYNKQLKTNLESIGSSLKTYRSAVTKIGNMEAKNAQSKQLQSAAISKYKEAISVLVKEQAKQNSQLTVNQKLEEEYKSAGVKNSQELIEQKQKEKQLEKDKAAEQKKAAREEKQAAKEAAELEKEKQEQIEETKRKVRELAAAIKDTIKGFGSGLLLPFKVLNNTISKIGSSLKSAFAGISRFGTVFKTKFIDKAIDYSEQLNLFNVVFENIEKNGETMFSELGQKATQFQNELNEAFGTNKMETMRYQGLYQSMGESAGLDKKYAYMMSENMTKLGYDLASLFNTTEQKAMESLRAGVFAGQTKPLRGYGIDVTQQTYKPVLADLGIDKKVSELSQAEKEVLRYIVAIRQATKSHGDFANTLESPANQLKVMKQQLTEVGVAIGRFFVNPFQRALQIINGVIMAIKALFNAFADLFGIEQKQYNAGYNYNDSLEDYSDGLDGIGDSASSTTKKMKELNRQTLAFDQINNITSPTNTGSSGSGGTGGGNYGIDSRLLDAMQEYENQMGKVKMRATEIRDTIMEWLGFTKEIDEKTKEVHFTYDTVGKDLPTILGEIGTNAGKGLNELTNKIDWEGYGKKLAEGVNSALSFINSFIDTYDWKNLGTKIADFCNNAIKNTDFTALGKTLTSKFKITISTLSGFVQRLDFKEIGSSIAETINSAVQNIPVSDLIDGLNALADGIFTALKTIFQEVDWGALMKSIFEILSGLDFKTYLLILVPALIGGIKALLGSSLIKTVISDGLGSLISGKILGGKGGIDTGSVGKTLGSGKMDLDIQKFGSDSIFTKLANINLKDAAIGIGKLAAIIGMIGAVVIAFGELTRIPGFTKYLSEGIDVLSKLFWGLAKVAIPVAGFAAGMLVLGKLGGGGVKSIALGLADLAIVIGGLSAIVFVISGVVSWVGADVIDTGIETIKKVFNCLCDLAIPIAGFTVAMGVLGLLGGAGVAAIAVGLADLAIVIVGLEAIVLAVGGIAKLCGPAVVTTGVEMITKIFNGLGSIAVELGIFTAALMLAGLLGGAGMAAIAVGLADLAIVIAGLELVIAAIGAISNIPGIQDLITTGLDTMKKIFVGLADIFGEAIGTLISSFTDTVGPALERLGTSLSNFMINATPFFDGIRTVDEGVANAVKNLATAILIICAVSVINSITSFLGLGKSSLEKFGEQLVPFGKSLSAYSKAVKDVNGSVVSASANSAKALAELAGLVPYQGGLRGLLFGEKSLKNFADGLPEFGTNLKAYSDNVKGVDGKTVEASANAAGSLAELAQMIPKSGGYWQTLFGAKDLGTFGKSLPEFGKNLKLYSDNIKGFDAEAVQASTNAAESIAELAKKIPAAQSDFSKFFTGDKSLGAFGAQVATFGGYMAQYSNSISNFNTDKAQQINSVVYGILSNLKLSDDYGISSLVKNFKKALGDYESGLTDFVKDAFAGSNVSTNKGTGYSMGQNIGKNIKSGIKNTLKDIDVKVTNSDGKSVSTFTIKAYANGGFPEDGFFFANHNELVGKFSNGKTAVANNEQIVTAIEAGVYKAVTNAMSNGGGFGSVDIQLHTDEGVVVDRINKITRQTGTCPINI